MSQTLVICSDESLAEILQLNLPIYVGTDVVAKTDYKNAEVLIEHHPGIHLIIVSEASAEALTKNTYVQSRKIPLIVLGPKVKIPNSPLITILPSSELKVVIQAAAKYLKVTPRKMIEQVVPDFFPISISFCQNLKRAPCAIYVLKGESDYQTKYSLNENVKTEEIKALIDAGTTTIYVPAPDRLKFVNHVNTSLLSRLTEAKSEEETLSATDESLHVVREEALKGESPVAITTQELSSAAIQACVEIALKNPSVASLLKKLLQNKASFLYKHTQLIIHVSQHIIDKMEWGSNEQKAKLAFVAFFHDICLTDDKYIKYKSDTMVTIDTAISNVEKDLIIGHAKIAADIVRNFPNAPIGADVIILQHHGQISGSGFAHTFTNSISPLAIVFIIAEEFAHLMLAYPENTDFSSKKKEMIARLNSMFTRSKYTKVIETLESITF